MNLAFAYTLKRIGLDSMVRRYRKSTHQHLNHSYFLGEQLYLAISITDISFARTRALYQVIAVEDSFLHRFVVHSNEVTVFSDEKLLSRLFDTMEKDDTLRGIFCYALKRVIEFG